MKGNKEGGEEKKERRGEKTGKGEKDREKKKKRETEKKKERDSRARTRDLPLCTAYGYHLKVESHIRTIRVYIANFDFDDLTVAALAALAPPIKDGHA